MSWHNRCLPSDKLVGETYDQYKSRKEAWIVWDGLSPSPMFSDDDVVEIETATGLRNVVTEPWMYRWIHWAPPVDKNNIVRYRFLLK